MGGLVMAYTYSAGDNLSILDLYPFPLKLAKQDPMAKS